MNESRRYMSHSFALRSTVDDNNNSLPWIIRFDFTSIFLVHFIVETPVSGYAAKKEMSSHKDTDIIKIPNASVVK